MVFILQVIGWVLLIYGFLSLTQDIINEITYKNLNHNMKIIVLAKNLESDIENFTRDLARLRNGNSYKNIIVVDLEKYDDLNNIIKKFETEEINLKVLNKLEGKEYLDNCFDNEN